ncbi:hypothetical protein GQX73_g299 [Xylaria multiplex]|uniref:Uncharacterized protein n=1 Tax=Xylaria multiplex TaxID=323545 RepID=A0A7C8MWK1_9PEZI|nr:hypothetical protein GQX73_g299 [Xylaria multiplex]
MTLTVSESSTAFSTGSADATTRPSSGSISAPGYPTDLPTPSTSILTLTLINTSSTIFSTGSTDAVTGSSSPSSSSYITSEYSTNLPTTSLSTLTVPATSSSSVSTTGATDAVTGSSSLTGGSAISPSHAGTSATCVAGYGSESICFTLSPTPSITGASSTDAVTGSIPTTFSTYPSTTSGIAETSSTPHSIPGSYPTYPLLGKEHSDDADERHSDHGHGHKQEQVHADDWNERAYGWKRFVMI